MLDLTEKALGRPLPDHWSVCSRCIPDVEKHLQKIAAGLVSLERRLESKKVMKDLTIDVRRRPTMRGAVLDGSWKKTWEAGLRRMQGALKERSGGGSWEHVAR